MKPLDFQDLPLGLAMALARNPEAMNRFGAMPPEQQQTVIEATHQVHSSREMRALVKQLQQNDR